MIKELAPLLWWLAVGHFLADYVFQTKTIAHHKRRKLNNQGIQRPFPMPAWYYWMTAHAMTHGAFVYLFTGSTMLAVAETLAHFAIDTAKCEGYFGHSTDQALHLTCKAIWAAISLGVL